MSNNLIEGAKLVDLVDKDGKITFTFLSEDKIYEVGWNKKAYDQTLNDFVESEEKEAKVEEWSQTYFGCKTKDLSKKLGTTHDIYVYDTYASLWQSTNRFTPEMKGQKWRTVIDNVYVNDNGIHICYKCDGDPYESKMGFTQKMGETYYLNPLKERKQRKKFEEKYGATVEDAESIYGTEILVECKLAFGKHAYGDITVL